MEINKIVITGATSSIGTALCDMCIGNNIKVLAIVQRNTKNIHRIPENELIEVVELNIDEYDRLDVDKYGTADAFIHLAWCATNGDIERNMVGSQALNIKYAIDAVDLAHRLNCDVFVGSGSQAEYGRTDAIIDEDTICNPETAYGSSKLCAGQLTRMACNDYGIRHIWPRILSAYGPNCSYRTVISYTIRELLCGRVPQLSAGEQIWDFIYTYDVAKALLLLAQKGHDGEAYVIGSGESNTLKNYLLDVKGIISPSSEMAFGAIPYGPNTVMHLECSIKKLRDHTGFVADTSFNEGIVKTAEWIKMEMMK